MRSFVESIYWDSLNGLVALLPPSILVYIFYGVTPYSLLKVSYKFF